MTTHWICLGALPQSPACSAGGTYEHSAQGGDSGDAWKHTKATGHSTLAANSEWVTRYGAAESAA